MFAQHHRWAIWNIQQHPYKHSLAEFSFTSPALPGVTNAEQALNFMIAVLYPNAKPAVATPADLPTGLNTPNPGDVTPTINDYRVVIDDGDGNFAAYRWEQREGDVSPQWYKVMDMDWSSDSILAQLLDVTLPLYVSKNGVTDIDENGDPITGLYAGQRIYGGDAANQNLTLNANSGDGVGPQTGYVQIDGQFRPTLDNQYDTGTATERWRTGYFATSTVVGTLTVAPASITDTSGTISFGDENLVTTGNIDGAVITGTTLVADDTVNQLTLIPGSITDTSGAIDFGDENLSTTGTLAAGVTTLSSPGTGALVFSQTNEPDSLTLLDATVDRATQSFIPNATGTIGSVSFKIFRSGVSVTGNGIVRIYTDNGSNEPDTLVATSSLVDISTIGTSAPAATVVSFPFSSGTITNAVKYHAVLSAENMVFGGGTITFLSDDSDPVAGVNAALSQDSGATWTQVSGGIYDLYLEVNLTGAAANLILNPGAGTITSSLGTIDFVDENLTTTGTITAGSLVAGDLAIDNLFFDNNRISITNVNGNLELQANGTGVVDVLNPMTTLGQTVTGTVDITGQLNVDQMVFNANTISTVTNNDINLDPHGSGQVVFHDVLRPVSDNNIDLGTSGLKVRTGYISTSLHNGVNEFLMSELMGLRSANWRDAARTQAAQPGDALFWSGTQWLASVPDSEIDHGTLTGILDDDHTQYMLLAGRAGGQTLLGGINANDDLVLGSTSNATKGLVLTQDDFAPVTDASFAAGWSGTDLGGPSNNFRDLYTKGELRGARMENFTSGTLPAASAQNTGRFVFATDNNKAYVDTGGAWQVLGVSKYLADTVWNGTDTTKDVNVSANIQDAREAIWALHDNANSFERVYTNIRAISATTVRITVAPALPAGSYRLIGIE